MRITHNKRTLDVIIRYIRLKQCNGVLKEPMRTIADGTGFSSATVHRALYGLQDQGVIRLIPPDTSGNAITILYQGPECDDTEAVIREAELALDELQQAMVHAKEAFQNLRHVTIHLQQEAFDQQYIQIH